MEEPKSSPNKAIVAVVVIALLAIAATAVIVMTNNKPTTDTSTPANTSETSDMPTNAPTGSSDVQSGSGEVKDGTYSATGSYQTPGGQESVGVKVTIQDGTITDATVTQMGKTGEAQEFQAAFASGYKSQVVGKKISEVNLTRVSGSSLTPNGFNNAIDDIEKQAQA